MDFFEDNHFKPQSRDSLLKDKNIDLSGQDNRDLNLETESSQRMSNNKLHTNNSFTKKKHNVFFTFIRFVSYAVMLCAVIFVVAAMGFLIFFRPTVLVSVPNLMGKSFVDASLLLQEKQLYPVVVLRYTNDPLDKGKVIEQEPNPSMSMRAKRAVRVVVSRGAVVSDVADYVGKFFNLVQDEIQSQFAGFDTLLSIKNVEKVVDVTVDPLIIIAQSPKAGSKISGRDTQMSFVVSRGDIKSVESMPDVTGLMFNQVFDLIRVNQVPFEFYLTDRIVSLSSEIDTKIKPAGIIVEQIPSPGENIKEFISDQGSVQYLRFGIRSNIIVDTINENDTSSNVSEQPSVGVFSFRVSASAIGQKLSIYKTLNGIQNLEYTLPVAQEQVSIPYFKTAGVFYEVRMGDITVFRHTITDDTQ